MKYFISRHVLQTNTSRHDSRLTCLGTSGPTPDIESQSTGSPKTPQRSIFEALVLFLNSNCIPFVLLTFTLRPFPSTVFFHLLYLSITSFNDCPHKIRSSAYNNSINEPSLTSSVRNSLP